MPAKPTGRPDRCDRVDPYGRPCTFGPGHSGKCDFTPYEPAGRYLELLRMAAATDVVRLEQIAPGDVNILRALYRRRYVQADYLGYRTWDYQITPAGKRVLEELPR